jgi:hypothetical protein
MRDHSSQPTPKQTADAVDRIYAAWEARKEALAKQRLILRILADLRKRV